MEKRHHVQYKLIVFRLLACSTARRKGCRRQNLDRVWWWRQWILSVEWNQTNTPRLPCRRYSYPASSLESFFDLFQRYRSSVFFCYKWANQLNWQSFWVTSFSKRISVLIFQRKIYFHSLTNLPHFHMRTCAPGLAVIKSLQATWTVFIVWFIVSDFSWFSWPLCFIKGCYSIKRKLVVDQLRSIRSRSLCGHARKSCCVTTHRTAGQGTRT